MRWLRKPFCCRLALHDRRFSGCYRVCIELLVTPFRRGELFILLSQIYREGLVLLGCFLLGLRCFRQRHFKGRCFFVGLSAEFLNGCPYFFAEEFEHGQLLSWASISFCSSASILFACSSISVKALTSLW